jgi:hypothetical protein
MPCGLRLGRIVGTGIELAKLNGNIQPRAFAHKPLRGNTRKLWQSTSAEYKKDKNDLLVRSAYWINNLASESTVVFIAPVDSRFWFSSIRVDACSCLLPKACHHLTWECKLPKLQFEDHATSPFKEAEITATRCNSFWLTANVSLFMG